MPAQFKWIIALFRTGLLIILFILMVAWINLPPAGQLPIWLIRNPIMTHLLNERGKVKKQAAVRTLNDFMPKDYDALLVLQDGSPEQQAGFPVGQYISYYQKVVEYIPDSGSAYGILGFCYYHQGKYDEAIAAYRNALQYSPQFFWFHYNLGVLLLKNKEYEEAATVFQRALKTELVPTMEFYFSSKVYGDLLRGQSSKERLLAQRLKAGYYQAQQLFLLSNYYLQKPEGREPSEIHPQLY